MKALVPDFLKVWYHEVLFLLSNLRYGLSDRKLTVIGVTGSSGKSTTAFMIYHILKESGKLVGLVSTVGAYIGDEEIDIGLHVTTPDAQHIPKLLSKMVKQDVEYAVIEVSSHALDQGRIGFLKFDRSTITNITSDHLDWHKNWDNYAIAKSKIIEKTKDKGLVVLNKDDKKSYQFIQSRFEEIKTPNFINYSLDLVKDIESTTKQRFSYQGIEFTIPLIGGYNISNALAAIQIAKSLGLTLDECANALESFETLRGHMEILKDDENKIILDFAHNTDSLKKSIIEARKLTDEGRVITLFGSAGLRDVKKRYDMGLESSKLSDIVIIVPEDPRTERLYDINSEILRGCRDGGLKLVKRFSTEKEFITEKSKYMNIDEGVFVFDYEKVEARVNGIELGIALLKNDDILITQGKGHEQSLCFGKREYPYDEKSVILNLLNKLK
jgi:UDP-N-acetylmuramoyl-L-alanyl-D-glutamate--2,6-diaminopimelate ligase